MTNLASTTLRAQSIETTTAISPTVMSIPNAPGHVKIRRIPKPKLFRSNPHKLLIILNNPDSDTWINDDGIILDRRRPLRLVDEQQPELSDYVKIRLLVARMKALEVYRKSLLQS
jgi:hypothetical protein